MKKKENSLTFLLIGWFGCGGVFFCLVGLFRVGWLVLFFTVGITELFSGKKENPLEDLNKSKQLQKNLATFNNWKASFSMFWWCFACGEGKRHLYVSHLK